MFVKRIMMVALLSVFGACAQAKANSSEFYRSFWYPLYHGEALAYCSKDDKQCGEPVAVSYCKMMGYTGVKQSLIAHNVGLTHYVNNQGECKGWKCSGFKLIVCKGELPNQHDHAYAYRSTDFVLPRFEHYRVDWCYKLGKECGARAAYSFCRRMGYSSASAYEKQENISATKSLGDHQLCFGKTCHGFSRITCHR